MFKFLSKAPKIDRRQRKDCCGDEPCDHPLRRDEDYRRAIDGGVETIKSYAASAADGLNQVTATLAKRRA